MKKMILPGVFALLFIAFVVVYAVLILTSMAPLAWKIIIGGMILVTAPLMVYAFVQRYREFKKEEEDDLSKY